MAIPGDDRLRCRKCESYLSIPKKVNPIDYALVENRHGAVVRKCIDEECSQLWLGYVQELPNGTFKIILKMIDKVL